MYVTDDEAAKLAFETVQQLAEIQAPFEGVDDTASIILSGIAPMEVIDEHSENQDDLKVGSNEGNLQAPQNDSNPSKTIQHILASLPPPTHEEMQEKRTPNCKDLTLTTPTQDMNDKENKPQLFSIFERSKVVKPAVSTVVAADAQITTASKTSKAITTEVKL